MKTETASATLNSSTAFFVPAFKIDHHLGWSLMPIFPATEAKVALGWEAMSAFGQAAHGCDNPEVVVDLVRETRAANNKTGLVKSFWNAVSLRA